MKVFIILISLLILPTIRCENFCSCEKKSHYDELGRNTWFLLHEIVKKENTLENRYFFNSFMSSLSMLYPCGECSEHIKYYIEEHPPELTEEWMCHFHNDVNARLEKPLHLCNNVLKGDL